MEYTEEIKYRDSINRPYILGRIWDNNPEFKLKQQIVKGEYAGEYTKDSPFIYDNEWEVKQGFTNEGKGDLILSDGNSKFMIVEIKFLDFSATGRTAQTTRRKKRRHLEKQTPKYMKEFKDSHPEAKEIIGLGVSNERIIFFKNIV